MILTIFAFIWHNDSVAQISAIVGIADISSSSLFPTTTPSLFPSATATSEECIQSFDTFAYRAALDTSLKSTRLLPAWQIEAVIPFPESERNHSSFIYPQITRYVTGQQEVWLILVNTVAIYRPKTQDWEMVSRQIENTDFVVDALFVTQDQTVWGKPGWNPAEEHPNTEGMPVLSKFNETARRFEVVRGMLDLPFVTERNYYRLTEIVLDNQNIFWIFAEDDGIYRYDPSIKIVEKRQDMPDLQIVDAALSTDGSIYFQVHGWSEEAPFQLLENTLFQFSPGTNTITPVNMPDGQWPIFSGLLVDHRGRLWLGSIGYRDTDGIWHLVHPHPEEYFDHLGDYMWSPATLIFESSDGVLWYRRYLDSSGWAEGIAWYDPKTEEGCLLTNQYTNIVEDSEQQLWIAADGKLYRHPVNP